MFSDIRGFTTKAGAMAPEETIEPLNTYYTLMFDAISGHGGVINQMIGDGLRAIFGAPLALADPCVSAVRAAQEMLEMVALFNLEPDGKGKTPIQFSVSIALGSVIAGYTGTDQPVVFKGKTVAVQVFAVPCGRPALRPGRQRPWGRRRFASATGAG